MIYAQYRLGAELIDTLPQEIRRTIGRFRQLFDMGLHGPELLLSYGQKHRQQSGKVFFYHACRMVRMEHSEGALAYLYGLIVHYALSSRIQPLIQQRAKELSMSEQQIRTEFDRFLLEKDGKLPPYRYDRSVHLHLTPGEQETTAMFYPGIHPRTVGVCVKQLRTVMHLSAKTEGGKRDLTTKMLRLTGNDQRMMGLHPERQLKATNAELLEIYEQAKELFPILLPQIQIRLRKKVALGSEFELPFA